MSLEGASVDLWIIDFDPASDGCLDALLSPAELGRAEKISVTQERELFVAARAALRALLSKYHPAVRPSEWVFRTSTNGKPSVDLQNLSYSVSHSGSKILIGVSEGQEIGVDIERVVPETNFLGLANRHFTSSEVASVKEVPTNFFALWVLKEAFAKCIGEGLRAPLSTAAFSLPTSIGGENFTPVTDCSCSQPAVSCALIDVGDAYRAAVVVREVNSAYRLLSATLKSLLAK